MEKLAYCYEEGTGCPADLGLAFEWFLKAELKGHIHAIWKIGLIYADGLGVDNDPFKAFEWFKKAALNALPIACLKLGECCREGVGCEKSEEEAVKWESQFESKLRENAGSSSGYQRHTE
jgi:TPR repeat protein